MSTTLPERLSAAAALIICFLAQPPGAAPHEPTGVPDDRALSVAASGDRLSVRAAASPWPALLDELRRHTGAALRVLPPPEGTVTVSFEHLPMDLALRLLFGPDASFVYVYRPATAPGAPAELDEVLVAPPTSPASRAAAAGGWFPGQPARAVALPRDTPGASAEGKPAPDDPATSVATLWHEDPELRRQALDEIVERGDGSGVEEVRQVLTTDQEAEVRARAVKALIRIGTPEALEALRPAMSDSEVTVRLGAVDAIASFETRRARTLLRKALRDPEEQVRVSAAAALRDLGSAGR